MHATLHTTMSRVSCRIGGLSKSRLSRLLGTGGA